MKTSAFATALGLAALLSLAPDLSAQPARGGMMAPNRPEDLLKRFDKNGDGKIDDDERIDAREAMMSEEMNRQDARAKAALPVPAPRPTPPAANGPQPGRGRPLLELFDKNRDGRLDETERAELDRYAEDRGLTDNGELRAELMKRFDKNGDDRLDDAERASLQAFQERRAQDVAMLRTLLMSSDSNQNGRIDPPEMAIFEELIRRRLVSDPNRYLSADRDGNGKIDEAEWLAVRDLLRRLPPQLPGESAAPAPARTAAEEQARLDQITAELQRRRLEREANPGARSSPPAGPGISPLPLSEQERLERVADEVGRRREMREDAAARK